MRRLESLIAVTVLATLVIGCRENGYRTEVKGNGQGGVEIQRVAVEPTQSQPQTATTQSQPPPEQQIHEQQVLIDQLQSQVQRQNEEIRRLKQAPTTSTTAP